MSTDLQSIDVHMDKTWMKIAMVFRVGDLGLIFLPFTFPFIVAMAPLVQKINVGGASALESGICMKRVTLAAHLLSKATCPGCGGLEFELLNG